jgi:hypothetical protein
MPKGKQAIYTQNLTSSTGTVNFWNIPQTYTDLEIVCTTRSDYAAHRLTGALRINNDANALYSHTDAAGYISNYSSTRTSGQTFCYAIESLGTSAVANAFGITTMYIPNYTSNIFKQIIHDTASIQNTTTGGNVYTTMSSLLYRSYAAIKSLHFYPGGGANFIAGSSFTLYGIAR